MLMVDFISAYRRGEEGRSLIIRFNIHTRLSPLTTENVANQNVASTSRTYMFWKLIDDEKIVHQSESNIVGKGGNILCYLFSLLSLLFSNLKCLLYVKI